MLTYLQILQREDMQAFLRRKINQHHAAADDDDDDDYASSSHHHDLIQSSEVDEVNSGLSEDGSGNRSNDGLELPEGCELARLITLEQELYCEGWGYLAKFTVNKSNDDGDEDYDDDDNNDDVLQESGYEQRDRAGAGAAEEEDRSLSSSMNCNMSNSG
jgi:hypothetical protein